MFILRYIKSNPWIALKHLTLFMHYLLVVKILLSHLYQSISPDHFNFFSRSQCCIPDINPFNNMLRQFFKRL